MISPLHFVDSPGEEEMQSEPIVSPSRRPTSFDSLQGIAQSVKGVRLSPDLRIAATFQGSPASARRGVKTTPKARLRHDDSQIQFAAIESSPLQPEAVESQYLTDRQKEVKERQGREAAAFPEIRSSPRSTSRPTDYVLPKLVFNSKPAVDGETSPTYLPDAFMDKLLGSSPTPSSKRSSDRRSDDDPPSSPPFIPPQLQTNQLTNTPQVNEDHAPVLSKATTEENPGNDFANESLPISKFYPSNDESIDVVEDDPKPIHEQEEAPIMEALQVPISANPVSDFDIYVDAPSVPSLNKLSSEHGDNQPNDIANSFQSEGSSRFSVEDDQVTAQLFTEMEHHSSQQSAKQVEAAPSAQQATKKRKHCADSSKVEKKMKRTLASMNAQAAAQVPGTGETVAECVMIDVREVDRSRPMLTQQIKRELSASPSILTNTPSIEETAMAEMKPVDHPMNSEVNQSSDGEHDTPMTKKAMGRPRGSRNSQDKREAAEKEEAGALRKSSRASERLSGSTTSSPHKSPAASQESTKGGQWLALGKTPRRGMFRWLQRSSAESEDLGTPRLTTSSANRKNPEEMNEHSRVQDPQRTDLSPADHRLEHQSVSHHKDREGGANQYDREAEPQGRGEVEREEEAGSAQGILDRFQRTLENIKRVTLGPEEERAMVGMLFDCVREVHEAGRRHTSM